MFLIPLDKFFYSRKCFGMQKRIKRFQKDLESKFFVSQLFNEENRKTKMLNDTQCRNSKLLMKYNFEEIITSSKAIAELLN